MAWVLRLVEIGAEGEGSCADVVEISRPDGLVDIADLGLTLAEAKLVLAGVQREIVAAQARDHAVRRPGCRRCEGVCRVKDYRQHAIATLFGQVAVRLPRFRCAGCGTTGTGVQWPPYARSTPELDRLRAQLSALLTYRTAAALLGQMFPVDAGQDPETLRRHTFKIAKTLSMTSAAEAPVSVDAEAIVVSLDSTFIRSCEDGERHLEVRIGNVETESGGRQVFGAVAKVNTDIGALIRRALDAVGRTGDTALTAFTDGCPGLRRILADAGVTAPPMLDWFHIAMRLQHLKQVAGAPIEIEVVSLDWKWLFIYPGETVAAVNRLVVPVGVPLHFKLTSSGVMNSFFVPQLGSQIYTMANMTSQLHLQADVAGTYPGLSAQFSGEGFADMDFAVEAVTPQAYAAWVAQTRSASPALDTATYSALAAPSLDVPPATFGSVEPGLFGMIVRGNAMPAAGKAAPGATSRPDKGT